MKKVLRENLADFHLKNKMKKSIAFVLVLFLIPFISAVEFNLNENFSQGETLLTKVSGNFLTSISKDNVIFYKDYTKIPIEYDVQKIDSDYYIYAFLSGKSPGNYSLAIENIKYMKGSEVIEENLVRNFSIFGSTADFSIKPGLISSSEDFSIEIQNLQDKEILVNIRTDINASFGERDLFAFVNDANQKNASVILKSGEIKEIDFKWSLGEPTFKKIEFKSTNLTYLIPAYIYTTDFGEKKSEFRFEPPEIILSSSTNNVTKRTIYLYNSGTVELKNISLSFSSEIASFINLSKYKIEKLEANSSISVELYLHSPGETEISGYIKAEAPESGLIVYSQISLEFLNNYIPPVVDTSKNYTKTCAELQGTICNSTTEICSVNATSAKDDWCCIGGGCKSKETNLGLVGKIIGIIIFVVILIAAIWFYKKKFSKAKKPVDLLKIARKE